MICRDLAAANLSGEAPDTYARTPIKVQEGKRISRALTR
jgi:hypothetical protein